MTLALYMLHIDDSCPAAPEPYSFLPTNITEACQAHYAAQAAHRFRNTMSSIFGLVILAIVMSDTSSFLFLDHRTAIIASICILSGVIAFLGVAVASTNGPHRAAVIQLSWEQNLDHVLGTTSARELCRIDPGSHLGIAADEWIGHHTDDPHAYRTLAEDSSLTAADLAGALDLLLG